MSPRALALALALALPAALGAGPAALGPRPAEAAVSVAISLDQLVTSASRVVVATALEQRSQWEELGGARRIVTYTRLTVDETVAGEPGNEVWVRTLGGVVDRIGQQVSGEAHLALGAKSLLFLMPARDGALVVVGMAQGHYPVLEQADRSVKLAASPDLGTVMPRPGPTIAAREVLVGATLSDAIKAVQHAKQVNDAKR